MIIEARICGRCGNTFMTENSDRLMCKECERELYRFRYGKDINFCAVCDKAFEYKRKTKKYCSKECENVVKKQKIREKRKKGKENRVWKCGYCSKEYKPEYNCQKYCGEECARQAAILMKREYRRKEKAVKDKQKRTLMKKAFEKRPELKDKPKDKKYRLRKYLLRTYTTSHGNLKFERDYNYFKPCKFDESNENLYYIHDFDDADLSRSLIKYTNTGLSEKEFEYYYNRGNLVFYEMLN